MTAGFALCWSRKQLPNRFSWKYYRNNVIFEILTLFVCAVNPLLIKEYGANFLRKVKTDMADSQKIARYAIDNGRIWEIILLWIQLDTI